MLAEATKWAGHSSLRWTCVYSDDDLKVPKAMPKTATNPQARWVEKPKGVASHGQRRFEVEGEGGVRSQSTGARTCWMRATSPAESTTALLARRHLRSPATTGRAMYTATSASDRTSTKPRSRPSWLDGGRSPKPPRPIATPRSKARPPACSRTSTSAASLPSITNRASRASDDH